jgi:hypothetical protein
VDRLSPGEAQRVARHAKRTLVGSDVAGMSRSDATKVHPPWPAVVRAELGAGLRLPMSELPAEALSTFKHAASMANPKFYELQRLRKSTWDTPRFVRGYDITVDEQLVLRPLAYGTPSPASSSGRDHGWPSPTSAPPARRLTSRSPPN